MNNKGQTLVIFIISIPIFIILVAFIIEGFIISYEKVHLSSLTRSIIKNNIEDKDIDIIKDTFKKNGVTEKVKISIEDNIHISFTHQVDSFFGKIINKDKYNIKIDMIGSINEDKVVIEKGS